MTPIQAIQMWNWFEKNLPKALKHAKERGELRAANHEKLAKRVNGVFRWQNRPLAYDLER